MDQFAMHNAAKYGNLKIVRQLVEKDVFVDSRDHKGRTPLHVAAMCGQYKVVQLLISSKCDINAVDRNGSTPVFTAADYEEKDVTDLLLHHGAQVNRAGLSGFTLLHLASRNGWADTVQHILSLEEEKDVSLDSRDHKGRTPLHVAAKRGLDNVVELLISSKCDINALDNYGYTPVLTAAVSREKYVTDLLLCLGSQVNRTNQFGISLLHQASENGWADTVQHILNRGEVDVNDATGYGRTPLMLAALADTGFEDCAEFLLRAGADPNRRDADKHTALHFAVEHGRTRMVQMLLGVEGLDLNPQDICGQTPLHWVCTHEVLREMMEAGADFTIRDKYGETAVSEGIRKIMLTVHDIRLFVQQGLFFQEREYVRIFRNSILKETVLKDVGLCTQSVVNKFHRQSLPELKSISYFAEQLPNIDKFKLNAREIDEVEELVQCEIERSNFCNVLKIHPMSLKALCILTLITSWTSSCFSGLWSE